MASENILMLGLAVILLSINAVLASPLAAIIARFFARFSPPSGSSGSAEQKPAGVDKRPPDEHANQGTLSSRRAA